MNDFRNAVLLLPDEIKDVLLCIPPEFGSKINEIRLRKNEPLVLNTVKESFFVTKDGKISFLKNTSVIMCDSELIQKTVFFLAGKSIHTYGDMIAKGFIPLSNGCKAGVAGCAVLKDGRVFSVSQYNSVNIRVSREHYGCSGKLLKDIDYCSSFLLVGQPLSGKTTLLRDICRTFGGEKYKFRKKIAVIDERDEIGSRSSGGTVQLGEFTDVLSFYPKAYGCDIALRTLSPDIMVLDEIGAEDETQMLLSSVNSGVSVIATAHGGSFTEVMKRPNIKKLADAGVFKKAVILKGKENPCEVKEVVLF